MSQQDFPKQISPNWIDRTIAYFDPVAGHRRFQYRARNHVVLSSMRGYDAAAKTRRTANWKAGSTSVNTEVRWTLEVMRNRSRDLVRNEPYATRAIGAYESNIVGYGITASLHSKKSKGRAKNYEMAWKNWAESLDCDFYGMNNFYGLQALAVRTVTESGEALIRRVYAPSNYNMEIPLQIQVLEPDFIDSTKDGETFSNGNFTVQGVEFDKRGRRVAYWLFDEHPGDQGLSFRKGWESKRVDAKEIIHLFRTDRAGQVRGVPWIAPVMMKMKDLSDFSDATLLRQKLANCFTAFVTNPEGVDDLNEDGTSKTPPIGDKLEPGIMEVLRPGQNIEFSNPPGAADFGNFSKEQLKALSSGLGLTYEILANDYSNVNFSSGRMGWIEFHRNVNKWQWNMLIPHMCGRTWGWFFETASIAGFGVDPVYAAWTPPRREMIDPVKETEATKTRIRSGLVSLSEAIRENGDDPEQVLSESAADMKRLKELGLRPDTDISLEASQEKNKIPAQNSSEVSQDETKE